MDSTRKAIRSIFTEARQTHKRRRVPCQPPFRIEIFWQRGDEPEIQTAEVEADAQDLAKQALRRHASKIYIRDANGKVCWDSGYASSMPRRWPKG